MFTWLSKFAKEFPQNCCSFQKQSISPQLVRNFFSTHSTWVRSSVILHAGLPCKILTHTHINKCQRANTEVSPSLRIYSSRDLSVYCLNVYLPLQCLEYPGHVPLSKRLPVPSVFGTPQSCALEVYVLKVRRQTMHSRGLLGDFHPAPLQWP